jgi:uncharacterized protein (AIM24 family)
MASLVLTGDTSGQVTIAAPAVAGTNTITLPASTGTAIISDASANVQFNSGYGSVATAYGCRAWVSFNGTGTVAIRGSGNVTSITDNGTGDYTINMTTAMPDTNYAVNLTSRITATGIPPVVVNLLTTTAPTASLFRICTDRNGVGPVDTEFIFASVFR